MRIENGALAVDATWVKSTFSTPSGNCVQLAEVNDGNEVAIRNSNEPEGPALVFTRAEVDAFLRGVEAGEFAGYGLTR